MKKSFISVLCIILCISVIFSFAGCSKKVELTEENVISAVEEATTALHEFNTRDLKKYVDSKSLAFIIGLAEEHEQFADLGRGMFASLEIKVISVDLENKTATVEVSNKDLYAIASSFTYNLTKQYSTMQLLTLINDETFLDLNLTELLEDIEKASLYPEKKVVTLTLNDEGKNIVIGVDEEAENAISGGALSAITSIVQTN